MSLTVTETGQVLTETHEGITIPADYSFASVNDYVHGVDRYFEELQWLCLGMATEMEKLRKDAERYRWIRSNRFGVKLAEIYGGTEDRYGGGAQLDKALDDVMAVTPNVEIRAEQSGPLTTTSTLQALAEKNGVAWPDL